MNTIQNKLDLTNSIIGFQIDEQIVDSYLVNLIDHNFKNENFCFNGASISYLKQINYFSKIKYINICNDKLEELYSKEYSVYKKTSPLLLESLDTAKYEIYLAFKRARYKKDISIVYEPINEYIAKLREWVESASSVISGKNSYDVYIKSMHPLFSCQLFEKIFADITPSLRKCFAYIGNNVKCIKPQDSKLSDIKSENYNNFLDTISGNLGISQDQRAGTQLNCNKIYVSNFKCHIDEPAAQNLLFKLKIDLAQVINFTLESEGQSNSFEYAPLLENYNDSMHKNILYNFVNYFYMKSLPFAETLSGNLKKIVRSKNKSLEVGNIFWLLNSPLHGPSYDEVYWAGNDEISYMLLNAVQYVLEKDLINGVIDAKGLIDGWKIGIKHYFDQDVDDLHILSNFNFGLCEFGHAGFNIFSMLNACKLNNDFNERGRANPLINQAGAFGYSNVTDFIASLKKSDVFTNDSIAKTDLMIESYKMHLTNKFGIDLHFKSELKED